MKFLIRGVLAKTVSIVGLTEEGQFTGVGPLMDYIENQTRSNADLTPPAPFAGVPANTSDPYAIYVAAVCFCGPNNVQILDGESLLPTFDPDTVV